jgi:hypothetical protein
MPTSVLLVTGTLATGKTEVLREINEVRRLRGLSNARVMWPNYARLGISRLLVANDGSISLTAMAEKILADCGWAEA